MKLVLYKLDGTSNPHHKNLEAIQRMCKSYNINFESTNCTQRIKENNYDILYCMSDYVNPYDIPENIKIIYGPQFWVIPVKPILGKFDENIKDRCVFNSLSNWIEDYFKEFGEFTVPVYPLPFAVNTDKFNVLDKTDKKYDCIVYIKRISNKLIDYTFSLLNEKKIKYNTITYGSYNEEKYLSLLHESKFMLTLDAHESQGFALEEAMSCNIPLLVMDATSMYDEMGDGVQSTYNYMRASNKKLLATSVPYWSSECGIKITEQSELSESIDKMMILYKNFTPRNYIIRTLSDDICMKRILDYFHITKSQ